MAELGRHLYYGADAPLACQHRYRHALWPISWLFTTKSHARSCGETD